MKTQEELKREHNMKLGLETWIPVSMAAKEFGISTRRVRALLSASRLYGRQLENGYWEVGFPFRVAMARRGPQLLVRRPKKPEQKLVGK